MHKEEASQLFKALGDESRLKIVRALYHEGELCACKLLAKVECGQPTLSHHMTILIESKLVTATKVGKWVHYTCNKDTVDSLLGYIQQPACGYGGKQNGNE